MADLPRYQGELFRVRNMLAVREWQDGWLAVEVAGFRGETITVRLDQFDARDLVAALSAWADGDPVPVGPREH